jgi:3-isopropylmalate dehydratase small subunit
MEFFMPEFRNMVKDGLNIVVAGDSFGCGSSRDVAVNTLLGAGVQCVIAKSFAFIYARNQPNIGLLGITITDEAFFMEARHERDISIDLTCSQVRCGTRTFDFQLSDMEKQLIAVGGLTEAFKRFGSQVFDIMCQRKRPSRSPAIADIESLKL